MGIQSNITIKSNVYVNKTKSQFDKDFIRQVQGYDVLKRISNSLGTLQSGLLSKSQHEELCNGSANCSLDKSGDKSWGVIWENGALDFVCKCEKTDCNGWGKQKGYIECSTYSNFRRIERRTENDTIDEIQYVAPDFSLLRYLDADDKIVYLKTIETSSRGYASPDVIFKPAVPETIEVADNNVELDLKTDHSPEERNIQTLPESKPQFPIKTHIINKTDDKRSAKIEYKRIENPKEIIEAGMESRIIVNAGPGTGKTYSVIKRLGYIVNNELVDLQEVLVLCYSRSAVSVIKKRINQEIDAGCMPIEARQLFDGIRTFDSFVTYMLSDVEIDGTINNLNYDDRIERFIKEVKNNKDCFDWLEYLIVDEMQDLVGARARMVKTILEQISCGFLLLGDMCQSIYDYQIKDENEFNSYRYYKWLDSMFDADVKRLELTKNVRQKEEFAMFSEYMREAILSDDNSKQSEALALCVETLNKENNIGNIRNQAIFNINKFTAILCRNNAEVSIISSELFENDVPHRVSKRAQHIDLVPWIAEILATYTDNRIGFSAFMDRAAIAGYKDAEHKWELLKSVAADEDNRVLDIRLLVKALVAGKDLPSEMDLGSIEATTVSSIHRSKGREYDNVVLLSENYTRNDNTLDEIKVAYVALTRGKENISFCEIPQIYTRQLESKRWIATGRSRKNNKYYCSNFDIGFDEDINPYGFVNKNIDNPIERQKYISKLKPGEILDAWLIDGSFKLFQNGVYIGMLSDKIFYELRDAMEKTNRSPKLPNHLSGIYVNNIVTIANTRFNDVIAEPYNKSGLWLGVEISGFAKTDWS